MKLRFFRRTSFIVNCAADIRRAAWRVLYRWKVPRIEICIEGYPTLDAQRSQGRLRHLNEVLDRQTGAILAIAVLIIGLADMVRTWNRDLDHMGMLVAAALAAGLAGRIIGRIFVRVRVLLELLRLRWKVGKWSVRRSPGDSATAPGEAAPAVQPVRMQAQAPALQDQQKSLLQGSCSCGTIRFTVSSPPSMMGTCHCAHCRKLGASAFVIVKRSAFRLTAGADAMLTCQPDAPHHIQSSFCSRCGTTLGEITSTEPVFRVAASSFDSELGARNGFHEYVGEKPGWYGICDEARQYETRPDAP